MRAAVCSSYGPPEVVRVEDRPGPDIGPGEARVRVHAAAVNFPDVLIVADEYQLSVPPPFVPGSEFAGVVDAVAHDVTAVAPGDRVSGTVMVGAFATEVAVAAESLRPVAAAVDLRIAAAAGVANSTAYHVLRSVAGVGEGDEVVVLGAGGGVGLATVQIAVSMGATVTAVASSSDKLDTAASYGARRVIDHRQGDFRAALREALPAGGDVVVDPVGGRLAEPALRALRPGGRFVTVGYASGEIPSIPLNLVLLKGITVLGFQFIDFVGRLPDEFERNETELRVMLEEGRVVPHIGASFALSETAAALRHVADGRAIGKVIIDVA